jgi:hypothetical protein
MSNLILGLFRSIQVRPEQGQAATMPTIFTSCPNSGRDISTGIEIEPKCFVDVPDVITPYALPALRQRHDWPKYNVLTRVQWRVTPPCNEEQRVNRELRKTLQLQLQLIVRRGK